MAPSKDKWVRRFVITETARHKRGFTIYKVTSVIFLKVSPEAVSKVSVWKRYNDFKKLHSELNVLHAALYIKDPFPEFPKPKFFGRFEAEVIEERRHCAIKLLEFIAKHTSLFTSNVFVKFFESSHLNDYLTDCSQSVSSDTSEDDRSTIPTDSESVNNSPNTSDSTLNTPSYLPKFVCTERIMPTLIKDIGHDGAKVRPNLENMKSPVLATGINVEDRALENCEKTMGNVDSNSKAARIETTEVQISDMNFVAFDPIESRRDSEFLSQDDSRLKNELSHSESFSQDHSKANNELSHVASFSVIHDGSDLPSAEEDSGQYILVAAAHMSAAFRHEAIAEFEEAFTQYKLGIANLLNGVQEDPDFGRRSTIKGKISKYLGRAERLYNRHLNCNVSVLSKPVSELQNYKVLRVMGSVMLVRDTLRECNRIIKSIPKPAGNKENLSDYILRGKVPYMVQLYACVQTETTVFLVLQYASGGKLWEYIKSYYTAHKNKLRTCEKGHIRSVSCDAIIQSNFNKENETSQKKFVEQKNTDSIKNIEITPEDSLKMLEEEFGANSKYNKNLPTTDLLENAQKLLRSVNATLKKSNSIASRLNGSEKLLLNDEDKTDSKAQIAANQSSSNSAEFEQNSSDSSNNVEETENTEDIDDLSELSASDSLTDLSLGKNNPLNSSSEADRNAIKEKSNINVLNFSSTNECTEKIRLYEVGHSGNESPDMSQSPVEYAENNKIELKLNGISFQKGHKFYGNGSLETSRRESQNSCLDKLQPQASEDSGVEMEEEFWKLPEGTIRLWAAEILLALESLHQQDVVVSDLRPDNILLGDGGHVAMSYIVPRRNSELPQPRKSYSAPELSMFLPTSAPSSTADVWSFGVLLYELFTGIQFQSRHPGPFHSHSLLSIPDELSPNAKALLSSVLKYQPEERLTIPEIKQHPFFTTVDWKNLLNP